MSRPQQLQLLLVCLQEGLTIQANGRWQQIKLLRAEWAHPRTIPGLYSRVLYITNLTPVSKPFLLLAMPLDVTDCSWTWQLHYQSICRVGQYQVLMTHLPFPHPSTPLTHIPKNFLLCNCHSYCTANLQACLTAITLSVSLHMHGSFLWL